MKNTYRYLAITAMYEIVSLRRQLSHIAPMAEAYEVIRAATIGIPQRQGEAEDIVWRIQNELENEEGVEAKAETKQTEDQASDENTQ